MISVGFSQANEDSERRTSDALRAPLLSALPLCRQG